MIKKCRACNLTSGKSNPTPLSVTEPPTTPWKRVAIDFHGPLVNGSELMSLIDECSGFPVCAEVKTTSAFHVLPKLDGIFSLMGIPEVLKSDNGPPFQGLEFKKFCEEFGVKHRKVTPEWPQANGQIENFNKNIKRLIQKSNISRSDFHTDLNAFLRSYRNSPHGSKRVLPASLIFKCSNSCKLPTKVEEKPMTELEAKANKSNIKAKGKMKQYYDR